MAQPTKRELLAQRAAPGTATAVTNSYTAQVPPKVRTAAYFAILIESALAALVTGVAAVWWPEMAPEIAGTASAILSATGLLAGGLGVAYRPTVNV